MAYHFKNLVFEGGGVKGIAYIGAMQVLKDKGILPAIERVGGTSAGAINATLSIMVGGDSEVFEQCRPIFEAMGKNIVHVGANGMGQTVKLMNQKPFHLSWRNI